MGNGLNIWISPVVGYMEDNKYKEVYRINYKGILTKLSIEPTYWLLNIYIYIYPPSLYIYYICIYNIYV